MTELKIDHIEHADVMDYLRALPDSCVNLVVTSPPYFGLRDYGTAEWEGGDPNCNHTISADDADNKAVFSERVTRGERTHCKKCGARRIDQQIGLEPTPAAYIARMVAVFAEVKRVLRADGNLYVNLASSWSSGVVIDRMNEPFELRDDLTPEEIAHVLSEIAAFSQQREVDGPVVAVGVDQAITPLASSEKV